MAKIAACRALSFLLARCCTMTSMRVESFSSSASSACRACVRCASVGGYERAETGRMRRSQGLATRATSDTRRANKQAPRDTPRPTRPSTAVLRAAQFLSLHERAHVQSPAEARRVRRGACGDGDAATAGRQIGHARQARAGGRTSAFSCSRLPCFCAAPPLHPLAPAIAG